MNINENIRCPITDLPALNWHPTEYGHAYKIEFDEMSHRFDIPTNAGTWQRDNTFQQNKHLIAGLLFNNKLLGEENSDRRLSLDLFREKLSEKEYPETPQEKYENLFLKLFELQDYDGQLIDSSNKLTDQYLYRKLYFRTESELSFYAKSLHEDGLIEGKFSAAVSRNEEKFLVDSVRITYKGLSYALKLMDEGVQSKNCFIAMSFGNNMGEVRNAIKKACIKTGFTPILVDEVHYDSDTTINDAIIANLRKSRFCIADFTEQKDGVYFESGFALGEGKQVIYACQEDWFKKSHFDTNHFPHIVYKTAEELTNALVNKIEAWIR